MASILVFGESDDAGLTAPTLEMLGAASRLSAELGGGVTLALIGYGLDSAAAQAGPAGADTVYTADSESLADYQTDSYLPVAQGIVEQDGPAVVLLSQSSMGRDLAPRLATRLESAAIMDSLGLEVDGDRVKATRSCYGGNARQVVRGYVSHVAEDETVLAPVAGVGGDLLPVEVVGEQAAPPVPEAGARHAGPGEEFVEGPGHASRLTVPAGR